ncbi:MAG: ABC transporter ATP-binding protein [Propionibacteriaceae bacterium]|nr:ABC transporter ATP-binding protein [Propionibacteriaceae bacterium]
MSDHVLAVNSAGYTFDQKRWLFRDVSWSLQPGQILALLAPTGRGKTTMLRCLIGLDRLKEGKIHSTAVASFVPQSHAPTFAYTALAMVVMGRARTIGIASTPSRKDLALAHEALDRVGLADLSERAFPTLSGGERQLVLLARAIVGDTKLLVLDEPASSLDVGHQASLLRLLRELCDEGWAAVMTTHHPDHAFAVADRALLLNGEEEYSYGSPDEVLTGESISKLYGVRSLVVPYQDREITGKVTATHYLGGESE